MSVIRSHKNKPYTVSKCKWDAGVFSYDHVFCKTHNQWLHICEVCGDAYHANKNSKTCSDKCRKAKSRLARSHNASKKQKAREKTDGGVGGETFRKLAVLASRWYTEMKETE